METVVVVILFLFVFSVVGEESDLSHHSSSCVLPVRSATLLVHPKHSSATTPSTLTIPGARRKERLQYVGDDLHLLGLPVSIHASIAKRFGLTASLELVVDTINGTTTSLPVIATLHEDTLNILAVKYTVDFSEACGGPGWKIEKTISGYSAKTYSNVFVWTITDGNGAVRAVSDPYDTLRDTSITLYTPDNVHSFQRKNIAMAYTHAPIRRNISQRWFLAYSSTTSSNIHSPALPGGLLPLLVMLL